MPRKKVKNPITLFYPNKMKVNDLSVDVIRDYPFTVKERDFYLFFHLLSQPYLALNTVDDKMMQIHSDIVKDILGRDYPKIIKALVKYGYILHNAYSSEYLGICKSYGIHPDLMDESQPLKRVNIEYDKVLHNKLERIAITDLTKSIDDNGNKISYDEGRQHVIATVNELRLVPDAQALEYVATEYMRINNPNSPESYFHYFNTNPLRSYGVDKFGKRVHNVITNLPKVIRKCLRFKSDLEQEVVELDIVNSQPFFLSTINSDLINLFAPECSAAIPVYQRYEANTDYLQFVDWCRDGVIYEECIRLYSEKYGNSYGSNSKEARDITKTLIYGVFFSNYNWVERNLECESKTDLSQIKKNFYVMFKDVFPSVHQLFNDLKSLYWSFTVNNNGIFKQYANNCLLAQRIESGVIYERVIPELLGYGITEVTTIHDCLVVKSSDSDTAKAIMIEVFNQIGLKPKIK